MKILIPSFSFPVFEKNNFDGKFVFSEAIAYAENGAKVTVLTPHYPEVSKHEIIEPGIEVIRFQYFFPHKWQRLKKPGEPLYNQKSLLSLLQIPFLCFIFIILLLKYSRRVDIIHAQWTITALFSLPAKWLYGKKIVMTVRGSDIRLLPRVVNRFIHSQVHAVIDCFGPQQWNDTNKLLFPAHYIQLPLICHCEPSGIMPSDMQLALQNKDRPFVLLYVGRFDRFKVKENHLPLINLIYAAAFLRKKQFDFHLFYIGDGDEKIKNHILAIIESHNLHNDVSLLGAKINVSDYIEFCDLCVGGIAFNAVSQEFTVKGKPQILVNSKDNAGTPWVHGVNSIFIKPDDIEDLIEKITWALGNASLLNKIASNAKQNMEQYIVNSKKGGRLYLEQFAQLLD